MPSFAFTELNPFCKTNNSVLIVLPSKIDDAPRIATLERVLIEKGSAIEESPREILVDNVLIPGEAKFESNESPIVVDILDVAVPEINDTCSPLYVLKVEIPGFALYVVLIRETCVLKLEIPGPEFNELIIPAILE